MNYLLYLVKVLLDIYQEYVSQIQEFRVIDIEYIANIPRGIVKLAFEVKPFGLLEF